MKQIKVKPIQEVKPIKVKPIEIVSVGTHEWNMPSVEPTPEPTDTSRYLKFTAREANSILYLNVTDGSDYGHSLDIKYSTDGISWVAWSIEQVQLRNLTSIEFTNVGDFIYVKGDNLWWKDFVYNENNYAIFSFQVLDGSFNVSGYASAVFDNGVEQNQTYTYVSMFAEDGFVDCSNLIVNKVDTAFAMFANNSTLTHGPVLEDNEVKEYAYGRMFYFTYNLISIRCLATQFTNNPFFEWCIRVSSTGTFYCKEGVEFPENTIPNGWNVVYV